MAQKLGRQGPWPRVGDNGMTEKRAPNGCFLTADGYFDTPGRPLAGPLRTGTTPHLSVGPKGRAVEAPDSFGSDMGMDRISPRDSDPMGWPTRMPQRANTLVATEQRSDAGPSASALRSGRQARRYRP